LGIRELDAVVTTHPDMDHVGGLDTLLAEVPIGRILVPVATYPDTPEHWSLTERRLLRMGIPLRRIGAGQNLSYGDGALCRVLAPGTGAVGSTNQASIVLRLDLGTSSILMAGDAEEESEAVQLRTGQPLDADILKVGHHGSRISTSPEWLAAVRPGLAVLSVGATNRYGHPTPQMLARLDRYGTARWNTARDGGIHLVLAPGSIAVEPAEPRWWKGPWVRASMPPRS
jgi:competence protein ComEC